MWKPRVGGGSGMKRVEWRVQYKGGGGWCDSYGYEKFKKTRKEAVAEACRRCSRSGICYRVLRVELKIDVALEFKDAKV